MTTQTYLQERDVAELLASGFQQCSNHDCNSKGKKRKNSSDSHAEGMHVILGYGWKPLCTVVCNGLQAEFLGGHDREMFVKATSLANEVMTCSQFERKSGRGSSKKWKESLHVILNHRKDNGVLELDLEASKRCTLLTWLKEKAQKDFGEKVVNQTVWIRRFVGGSNTNSIEWACALILKFNASTGKHTVQYLSSGLTQDLHLPAEQLSFHPQSTTGLPMNLNFLNTRNGHNQLEQDMNKSNTISVEQQMTSKKPSTITALEVRQQLNQAVLPHQVSGIAELKSPSTHGEQQEQHLQRQTSGISISSTSVTERIDGSPKRTENLFEGGSDCKDESEHKKGGSVLQVMAFSKPQNFTNTAKQFSTPVLSGTTLPIQTNISDSKSHKEIFKAMARQISQMQVEAHKSRHKKRTPPTTPHQKSSSFDKEDQVRCGHLHQEETKRYDTYYMADSLGKHQDSGLPSPPNVSPKEWTKLNVEERICAVDWLHCVASILERDDDIIRMNQSSGFQTDDCNSPSHSESPLGSLVFARFHSLVGLLHGQDEMLNGLFHAWRHQFKYWEFADPSRLKEKMKKMLLATVDQFRSLN